MEPMTFSTQAAHYTKTTKKVFGIEPCGCIYTKNYLELNPWPPALDTNT